MGKSGEMSGDWQLPPGVTRGLWDYAHSEDIAKNYGQYLAGTSLLSIDQSFVERHLPGGNRKESVIDLGCGPGRHLAPLARRGFDVLGVDLSAPMLRAAARNLREAGLRAGLLRANLVELDALRDASADHALCMFSTLGMIQGAENRRRVLEHVHRLLRPGGLFLLHVHNRWHSLWNRVGRRWLAKDVLSSVLLRRPAGDQIMPFHQGVANLFLHLFTRAELVSLLREAGFDIVELLAFSLRANGRLRCPWWLGGLRAHGYLAATRKR